MIGALPVLAAGIVGTCLGLVVAEFRHRAGPPMVPLAKLAAMEVRAELAEHRAETAGRHLRDLRAAAAEQELADEHAASVALVDFSAAGKVGRVFDVPLFDRASGPVVEVPAFGGAA